VDGVEYDLTTATVNGAVTTTGIPVRTGSDHTITARTTNGAVRVEPTDD
jgi:DUF4097 and DUF4098 domain-containing protein YvlB